MKHLNSKFMSNSTELLNNFSKFSILTFLPFHIYVENLTGERKGRDMQILNRSAILKAST